MQDATTNILNMDICVFQQFGHRDRAEVKDVGMRLQALDFLLGESEASYSIEITLSVIRS